MDYESHPDDNTDYAHATYWAIKWTCRCGKRHVTSSPGRYVTQTCKKCGVRWEIAPHFHDTTYHECATEPITEAAEIESQPQDGRRIENRVSALENSLFKLSEDHNTTLRQMIDLQRQMDDLRREVSGPIPKALIDCGKCHNTGFITGGDAHGFWQKPCDCGRAPVAMNNAGPMPFPTPPPAEALRADLQAYADLSGLVSALRDDLTALTERFVAHSHEIDIHATDRPTADGWESVERGKSLTSDRSAGLTDEPLTKPEIRQAQPAAPRIDPEDEVQVKIVMDQMPKLCDGPCEPCAKALLNKLALHLKGPHNG